MHWSICIDFAFIDLLFVCFYFVFLLFAWKNAKGQVHVVPMIFPF
jgi:hypothetical protein